MMDGSTNPVIYTKSRPSPIAWDMQEQHPDEQDEVEMQRPLWPRSLQQPKLVIYF